MGHLPGAGGHADQDGRRLAAGPRMVDPRWFRARRAARLAHARRRRARTTSLPGSARPLPRHSSTWSSRSSRQPLWLEAPLEELVVEDDRVVGVRTTRDGRSRCSVRARRGVMLAGGGFDQQQATGGRSTTGSTVHRRARPATSAAPSTSRPSAGAALRADGRRMVGRLDRAPSRRRPGLHRGRAVVPVLDHG